MTAVDELFEPADEAKAARFRPSVDSIQRPLAAIRATCEEAKRSWSGSNLGYHATVYFQAPVGREYPSGVDPEGL